jgi:hypothetical protein
MTSVVALLELGELGLDEHAPTPAASAPTAATVRSLTYLTFLLVIFSSSCRRGIR